MELSVESALQTLINQYPDRNTLKRCLYEAIENLMCDTPKKSISQKKPVRVYIDGCFDIMHSGHYNALRQAKKLGDVLVVGVHNDEEIARNKGPTIMNDEERLQLVQSCKWVDEVAFGVPYSPTVELLDSLNCDFAVHGDDMPTNAEGTSAYDEVIKAGRCKIIKRTEGVSTTSLVGRLLLMTREHHLPDNTAPSTSTISISEFLPTVQRLCQFSKFSDANYMSNIKAERVVYIDGAFDLFHVGHVEILKKAKSLGDFLLVGIHEDKVVNSYMGKNYPIMNSYERVLNVLSCKYVDEVILAAPRSITLEMITTMNIKVVVCGFSEVEDANSYKVPKDLGIYTEIKPTSTLTTEVIVDRILANKQRYEAVYERKKKKEENYWKDSVHWRSNMIEL